MPVTVSGRYVFTSEVKFGEVTMFVCEVECNELTILSLLSDSSHYIYTWLNTNGERWVLTTDKHSVRRLLKTL